MTDPGKIQSIAEISQSMTVHIGGIASLMHTCKKESSTSSASPCPSTVSLRQPIMARTRKPAEPSTMDVHAATPENRPIHAGGKSIEGLATLQAEVYQRVGRRVPDSEAVQLQSFKTDSFRDKMAARSRPRNGAIKEDPADAHEELSMWDQIEKDIKKCSAIQKRCREVSKQIVEMEEKMGKRECLSICPPLRREHICEEFSSFLDMFSCCPFCYALDFRKIFSIVEVSYLALIEKGHS